MPHQIQEFHPRGVVVVKAAEHGRRDHHGILLLDAPHHHAQVLGLHDDAHALRVDGVLEDARDLLGHAFLDLEPPRKALDHARELAHPVHLVLGDVADVALAEKRQHVMLADAVELDVLHDDHVVALFVEDGVLDEPGGIFLVTLEEKFIGLAHPFRRLEKPFAFGILAD